MLGRPDHKPALRSSRLPLAQQHQGQHFAITQLTTATAHVGSHWPRVVLIHVVDQAINCRQEGVHVQTYRRFLTHTRPVITGAGTFPVVPLISASSIPEGEGGGTDGPVDHVALVSASPEACRW